MARRVAVVGSTGQLGRELVRAFTASGDEVLGLARPDFDLTRAGDLDGVAAWNPDIVVNAAAWTDVDGCARDPERAMRINAEAAGELARRAARAHAMSVQISTNEVFDGTQTRPYAETDEPRPVNPYGASKLAGERRVAEENRRHLVIRTAWLYGGAVSFPTKIRDAAAKAARDGTPLRVVNDEWGNPTDVRWLAPAIERLVSTVADDAEAPATYHLAGWPPTTRYDWARLLLADVPVRLEPIPGSAYVRSSEVPPRAVLDVSRAERLGLLGGGDWRLRPG